MSGAFELGSWATRLTSVPRETQEHENELQRLIDRLKDILKDYSALQGAFKEVVGQRDWHKNQARGQVRTQRSNE
jgi:hypothetical protein